MEDEVLDNAWLSGPCEASVIFDLPYDKRWERAAELGPWFMEELRRIGSPKVREVRGMGLMIGIELKEKSAPYITRLEHFHHVLTLAAGPTVIRFLPPLVIEKSDLERVVEAVREVLAWSPKE